MFYGGGFLAVQPNVPSLCRLRKYTLTDRCKNFNLSGLLCLNPKTLLPNSVCVSKQPLTFHFLLVLVAGTDVSFDVHTTVVAMHAGVLLLDSILL